MSEQSPAEAIFFAVLEKNTPEERAAYLEAACGGDVNLRRRVERLLAAQPQVGSFLEEPAEGPRATEVGASPSPESLASTALAEGPGTVIGPYKLLQQIGEGGMGAVFMAEQTQPVQRRVALKIIKPGMDSRQVIARFEAERQALAVMDHPNIAKVLDAGTTATGRPYFVMELVKGVPITQFCDQGRLTPKERLELFIPVCQAVQHAHQKGIIHRDLKPSNVLMALYDGKPVPKVIDFGIAKATGPKLTERTLFTEFGQVVGTLEYMSPEQAELNQLDIDTRSDVYSLGVVLYELLTGTTPLERRKLKEAAVLELLRLIREVEPPKPSMRLSTTDELPSIAANRSLEPKKLSGLVRGELDWIVMKALEKDRSRRYESANSLALDLQRYLHDEPVQACPPSAGYRLRKFARKNRGLLTAVAAFALLLLLATAVSSWLAVKAKQAEAEAKQRQSEAVLAGKQALEQRDRADQNLRLAREAVDKTVTKITGNPRLKQANFHQLRHELLQSMMPFYEEFVKQRQNDPELEAERGRAWHSLAILRNEIGEKERARSDYEQVRAIFAQLAADFPALPQYRLELANSHNHLGVLLKDLGKRAEAESAYRQALKIQAQLAQDFPAVPQYRLELARSHLNLGYLLHDLGKQTEAESADRDALKIYAQLAQDFPGVPQYRLELAKSHHNLGMLLRDLGKLAEAETASREALKIRTQLAQDFPAVPEYRQDLAKGYNNLGILLVDLGKRAEAETAYREALKIQTQLAQDFPAVPQYRGELANSHNSLGILLDKLGKRVEAEVAYRDALKIQTQLAQDFPAVPQYRGQLASSHNNLGLLLDKLGKRVEAEVAYRDALKIQTQLAAAFPTVPDYQNDLSGTLVNLADLVRSRKDPAQAHQLLEQALPHHQAALQANPRNPKYRTFFRNNRRSLASTLVDLGDHAAAAAAADQLIRATVHPANDVYNAACIFARCVPLAERDSQLSETQRKERAQTYADRALATLRQAVQNGYKDVAHMKKDTDLDSLRSHPDFQKLLQELEAKP